MNNQQFQKNKKLSKCIIIEIILARDSSYFIKNNEMRAKIISIINIIPFSIIFIYLKRNTNQNQTTR